MKVAEPEQAPDINSSIHPQEVGAVEDIYVPGIGVRGALDDDPAEPVSIWPRVFKVSALARAMLAKLSLKTEAAARSAQLKVAAPRIDGRALKHRVVSYWHNYRAPLSVRIRSSFENAAAQVRQSAKDLLASVGQFYGVVAKKLTLAMRDQRLKQGLQSTRNRVAHYTQAAQSRIKVTTRSMFWSRTRSFSSPQRQGATALLARTAQITRAKVRDARRYCSQAPSSVHVELDWSVVLRASPSLVILLVIMIFAVQQVMTMAKR